MDQTREPLRTHAPPASTDRHRDALGQKARCPVQFRNTSRSRRPTKHCVHDDAAKRAPALRAAAEDRLQSCGSPPAYLQPTEITDRSALRAPDTRVAS